MKKHRLNKDDDFGEYGDYKGFREDDNPYHVFGFIGIILIIVAAATYFLS